MQEYNYMKRYLWHRFVFIVLRPVAGPVVKRMMGYSCGKQKGPDKPSLIIANHNANLDPAFVALAFSRHMYFLASEHAFRGGLASKLLKFAFAPIPINKVRTDLFAVKEMIRKLKAGANVCIFAEGDRSFNGVTSPISISTAKLVKSSGADLITFRIEGGYFTTPRWASGRHKGEMTGGTVGRYAAAELAAMTSEQILAVIERDIYEDAYERQLGRYIHYKGENLAEHIETALYLCPGCKKIGTIKSKGARFFCECGLNAVFTETVLLEGETLPFSTITQWDNWQSEQLADIVKNAGGEPLCIDEGQRLYEIDTAVGKKFLGEGTMQIDSEVFRCAGLTFELEQIAQFAVTGQMRLHFGLKNGTTYEVLSVVPRSALKYRELFRVLSSRE